VRLLRLLIGLPTLRRSTTPSAETVAASGPSAKRLVLEELRNVLARKAESADALDGKLKAVLSTASIVITLITALDVTTAARRSWLVWVGLIVILVLYVILMVRLSSGLSPITYEWPIPSGEQSTSPGVEARIDVAWAEIKEKYFDRNEDEALEQLIVTYLHCINTWRSPLESKARTLKGAIWLLTAIVILALVAWILDPVIQHLPISVLPLLFTPIATPTS